MWCAYMAVSTSLRYTTITPWFQYGISAIWDFWQGASRITYRQLLDPSRAAAFKYHCALARGEGRQIIEGGSLIWQMQGRCRSLSVSSYFVDYHVVDCSIVYVKSIFFIIDNYVQSLATIWNGNLVVKVMKNALVWPKVWRGWHK